MLRNKAEKEIWDCQGWGRMVREWPTGKMTFEQISEGRSVQAEGQAWAPEARVNFALARKCDGANLMGRHEREEQQTMWPETHVMSRQVMLDLIAFVKTWPLF